MAVHRVLYESYTVHTAKLSEIHQICLTANQGILNPQGRCELACRGPSPLRIRTAVLMYTCLPRSKMQYPIMPILSGVENSPSAPGQTIPYRWQADRSPLPFLPHSFVAAEGKRRAEECFRNVF
jgi:hypothetical protein